MLLYFLASLTAFITGFASGFAAAAVIFRQWALTERELTDRFRWRAETIKDERDRAIEERNEARQALEKISLALAHTLTQVSACRDITHTSDHRQPWTPTP